MSQHTQQANVIWNRIFIILGIALTGFLFYLLEAALVPFFLAALLAYFSNPLVLKLMRFGLSRIVAVSIVFSILFLSIILIILLVIPLIQKQIYNFGLLLPDLIARGREIVDPIVLKYFDINLNDTSDTDALKTSISKHFLSSGSNNASVFLQTILTSSKAIIEVFINIILIPVVTFYFLRDWEVMMAMVKNKIPKRIKPRVLSLAKECDNVLGAFFRGQLLVMLCLSIFYSIALTLLGIKIGVIIGLIVGLISIVPYLGAILGVVMASIAALLQFGTFTAVLWVWLIFIIGHSIENFYLTPKLIGDRIGLHPVVVIFAILAGGTLFGFLGVLLAMPVAALSVVFFRHLRDHYHEYHLKKTV